MCARCGGRWRLALAAAAMLCGSGVAQAQLQPWKFIVFGDSRGPNASLPVNTNILGELALEVVAQRPAFLLYLGDFSVSGGAEALALWAEAMAPVFRAGIPIYPVIGNHDVSSLSIISNLFSAWLPGNGPVGDEAGTYSFVYNNALILVLNQFVSTNQYRVNQAWLDTVLATNVSPHVFAAGHMPAFKVLHYDGLNYFPAERDRFWNSLSNANARIYFAGHDHFYDHSRIDDRDGIEANPETLKP